MLVSDCHIPQLALSRPASVVGAHSLPPILRLCLLGVVLQLIGDFAVDGGSPCQDTEAARYLPPERHRSALRVEQTRNGGDSPVPVRRLELELLLPGTGQTIELRAPGVLGLSPLGVDETGALEALEGDEQGPGIHLEHAA